MEVAHLNQKQLAARWSISEATPERWRSEGDRTQVPEALRPGALPAGGHRGLRGVVPGDGDQDGRDAGQCWLMFCFVGKYRQVPTICNMAAPAAVGTSQTSGELKVRGPQARTDQAVC